MEIGKVRYELKGRKVVVVGAAKTGLSVARFLAERGAYVCLTDLLEEKELGNALKSLKGIPVRLEMGMHRMDTFLGADLIVVSPGVPLSIEPVERAIRKGIAVISEVELAFAFIEAPIVAITGTNGKTTTTSLLGAMMEKSGRDVFVGGNIGRPLIEMAMEERPWEIAVAEISSFQLEAISSFRPFVGILLNLSEDHLDRYRSYKDYCEAKARLFMNQMEKDFAILNRNDRDVMALARNIRAQILTFGVDPISSPGAYMLADVLIYRDLYGKEEHYDLSDILIRGDHNRENIMAAIMGARLCNCSPEAIYTALKEARGLEHRLEYVTSFNGVSYYNDSKATNTGAVVRALQSFKNPVILIAGGKDKGIGFGEIREEAKKRVKAIILMGEARERMARELDGSAPISFAGSMRDAVALASALAEPGDVVLLSPACSSFDWYKNYEERGEDFKREVLVLKRENERWKVDK